MAAGAVREPDRPLPAAAGSPASRRSGRHRQQSQAPIPARQPIPSACMSGTVAAEASIAPATRPAVYGPVTAPAREGNQAFTTPGSSAPPRAIPTPATRVPPYSGTTEASTPRASVPQRTRTSAQGTAPCRPTRRVSAARPGRTAPCRPRQGDEEPGTGGDRRGPNGWCARTGGTAAMAGRRFSATPTTTRSSAHPGRVVVGHDGGGLGPGHGRDLGAWSSRGPIGRRRRRLISAALACWIWA